MDWFPEEEQTMKFWGFLAIVAGLIAAPAFGQPPKMKKIKVREPIGLTAAQVKDLQSWLSRSREVLTTESNKAIDSNRKFSASLTSWTDAVNRQLSRLWEVVAAFEEERQATRAALRAIAAKVDISPAEMAKFFTKEVEKEVPADQQGGAGIPALDKAEDMEDIPVEMPPLPKLPKAKKLAPMPEMSDTAIE